MSRTRRWRSRLRFSLSCVVAVALVAAALVARESTAQERSHMSMQHDPALSLAAAVSDVVPLSRAGWTATASDTESRLRYPAARVLDGRSSTSWLSQRKGSARRLPHWLTLDMVAAKTIAGLAYLPRQGVAGGRVGRFTVSVRLAGRAWSRPVASGTWADDGVLKLARFAPVRARYVRLTAVTEAGHRGPWSDAAELNVLRRVPSTTAGSLLARAGWTATASDQETSTTNGAAANVLDGSKSTVWHSRSTGTGVSLPHWIQIDTGSPRSIGALLYTPRAGSDVNGRIGSYRVSTSLDGTSFTTVATGSWLDDSTDKAATFTRRTARFVRLTALTEVGGRGPWSVAGEINLVGTSPSETGTSAPGPTQPPTPSAPRAAALPASEMSATASDEESASGSTPASNVVDKDASTIWHSRTTPTTDQLPHWIQLDTGSPHPVTGLTYRPRQDGSADGTIGRYEISTSSDGSAFDTVASGTWADDTTTKTVTFGQVTVRYVRVTALSEAGDRGPWSSAAEIRVLSPDGVAGAGGSWGPTKTFPLVPVAAAILPGNKMVLWSAYQPLAYKGGGGYTQTALWDLTTGDVSQRTVSNTGHDMFCPGVAMLADGRIMVTGGANADKTSIYDPASDSWSSGPAMNVPRGYQGMTLLSTGQPFVMGGSWSGGAADKTAEVWTESSGWRTLSGVPTAAIQTNDAQGIYRSDNHGWFFGTSGGRVFHAGPSKRMNWISTVGDGSITSAGQRSDAPDMMNGNAVYYAANKILTVGGSPSYQNSDATKRAYTVDIGGDSPVTTRVSDMNHARAFANSVVLPDGKVLTIGGQPRAVPFTDTNAVMEPELWDPRTGDWTQMAAMPVPRTYHSVALLLPDGRVFSGGGGLCGTCSTNHPDGEIFSPPYLLDAEDGSPRPRPVITQAPGHATLGSTISVTTDEPVASFALVRAAGATHSVDNDQRRLVVPVVSSAGTSYQLRVPSDPGVAPPGNWMLFALDASGTPSVSTTLNLPVDVS